MTITKYTTLAPYTVAISRYHQGQTRQPICRVYRAGKVAGDNTALYAVSLVWSDSSIAYHGEGTPDFSPPGDIRSCEKWLESKGVRLDSAGIHRRLGS